LAVSRAIGVAFVLLRGKGNRRLIDVDGRLRGVDRRSLNLELSLLAGDCGARRGDVGFGLVERHPEIALIDPRQYPSGLDALVIADEHLMQVTRDFGRDGRVVGLHVSVIGRDQEAADHPVIPAVPHRAGENRHRGASHQQPAEIELFYNRGIRCIRAEVFLWVRHQILDGIAGGNRTLGLECGGMAGHDGYSLMAFAPAHLGNLIFSK
jgi:hypothetical protein